MDPPLASHSATQRAKTLRRTSRDSPSRDPEVVFDVRKYGGKWVATQRGAVIAASVSLEEVERILDEAGVGNDVVLTKVPRSGDFAL